MFFDTSLLKKLIKDPNKNCALVNKKIAPPEKDFKALIENDRIVKIDVKLDCKKAFFLTPLYKFSKNDFLFWMGEIEKTVKAGELKIYAENVLIKYLIKFLFTQYITMMRYVWKSTL